LIPPHAVPLFCPPISPSYVMSCLEHYVLTLVKRHVYNHFMDQYIKPSDVHAPKRHWSLIQVLFDGGEGQSSLAIGRWDNRPVLAMRWNGTKDNPLGNPQSRGLPTWFVVPDQHWKQILESEAFRSVHEDALALARGFLEFERVYALTRCPNPRCRDYQKLVLLDYRTRELGAILDKLNGDKLKFYHIVCDGSWKPTKREKDKVMPVLRAAWDDYRQRAKAGVEIPPAEPKR